MTLSQIKKEIHALKRQYAVPLAVVRIRRLAHDFCNEWETAREEGKPTMHTNPVRPVVHPEGNSTRELQRPVRLRQALCQRKRTPPDHRRRQGHPSLESVQTHH